MSRRAGIVTEEHRERRRTVREQEEAAMYPKVKPALARAWRDLQTVQFGVTPAHAVVLGPVDTATGALIDRIDGTRGMELLRAEARGMGLPEGLADGLVRRLAGAGLIDDATAG
ncbi:thiamine biosynthesis protein ThiF, partial [Streptomyces sp. RSD-27]